MMKRIILACAVASFAALALPQTVLADSVQVTVKSNYSYKVQIEFYAQNRSAAWPGGGQAYALDDYANHTFSLSCRTGEKICYGAWVTGNGRQYWGVGANNRQSCSSCCFTCGAGNVNYTLQD